MWLLFDTENCWETLLLKNLVSKKINKLEGTFLDGSISYAFKRIDLNLLECVHIVFAIKGRLYL